MYSLQRENQRLAAVYQRLHDKVAANGRREQLQKCITEIETKSCSSETKKLSELREELHRLNLAFPVSDLSELSSISSSYASPSTQRADQKAIEERVPVLVAGTWLNGTVTYTVDSQYGHGGQGLIYKAHFSHEETGELFVAIKQQLRRRADIAGEAQVYFKLDPTVSVHLSLLTDVVSHHSARPYLCS